VVVDGPGPVVAAVKLFGTVAAVATTALAPRLGLLKTSTVVTVDGSNLMVKT
jgi:hypothetical protein